MAVYEAVLTEKVFFSKIFSSIDLRVIQSYLYTFARQYVLGIIDEQAKRLELTLNEKSEKWFALFIAIVWLALFSVGYQEA